jgi:NTP pyrophosphatase (non-canonical NTP hydrolase)
VNNLEKRIAAWHAAKFGPAVNLPKTYRKLLEEVGELGEAMISGDARAIQEEAGDVALVLCHLVRGGSPDAPSLEAAMELSLMKCEKRLREARKT